MHPAIQDVSQDKARNTTQTATTSFPHAACFTVSASRIEDGPGGGGVDRYHLFLKVFGMSELLLAVLFCSAQIQSVVLYIVA